MIFEPFVQGARGIDRAEGGLGIGLALVHSLVSLHGGAVSAHSDGPGRGSRFTVSLPRSAAATPPLPPAAADPPIAVARTPRRVLLVDDNLDAAESLSALLGLLGHDVRIASDGSAALTAAAEFRPDVVLCDIGLPRMDGYQVVAALRAQPRFATTRFVALTGYGRDEDRRRSLAAGFDAHLVKPVELATLTAAIEA